MNRRKIVCQCTASCLQTGHSTSQAKPRLCANEICQLQKAELVKPLYSHAPSWLKAIKQMRIVCRSQPDLADQMKPFDRLCLCPSRHPARRYFKHKKTTYKSEGLVRLSFW